MRDDMCVCPNMAAYHDSEGKNIIAEVELPGVRKKDIVLEGGKAGFCLKAKREDVTFDSCYRFGEEVETARMSAEFHDGLLRITAPIDESFLHTRKISVH